ncbi:hypothetical protein EFT49_08960 [Leuconostoc falkenbergense]|uniref:hypothetical protein n=1 Tax=Leuconostoc falkenbergense TaxID=2766470 RepID=UPI0021A9C6D1|nr:hypothetical protein [Leuconostoc falkenbergense]MCT4420312.1 hypothetical protein [Leuconostoc falkenbergense]
MKEQGLTLDFSKTMIKHLLNDIGDIEEYNNVLWHKSQLEEMTDELSTAVLLLGKLLDDM